MVKLIAVGLAALLAAFTSAATAPFTLSSPAFGNGAPIPTVYTCSGKSTEPVLRWRGVPAGTRSFVLQVVDPDAKVPRPGFVHWVAYNIPPSWRTLGPGSPHIYTNGKNGTGKIGYIGPCPPIGDPPHHYHFTLYALNVAHLSGPPLTQRALQQSIKGRVLGAATLIGTFQRR